MYVRGCAHAYMSCSVCVCVCVRMWEGYIYIKSESTDTHLAPRHVDGEEGKKKKKKRVIELHFPSACPKRQKYGSHCPTFSKIN